MLQRNKYADLTRSEIENEIISLGFHPVLIDNQAGDQYHQHKHPETKLIVILKGTMTIQVGNNSETNLKTGDQIIILGNTYHQDSIGKQGCTFYWSEKIL